MLVSEDYPWGKLLREYATYCAVGCINVAVFFLLYDWLYDMVIIERWRASSAWAIAYFVSSWQAHFLHRWLTFESPTSYAKSLYVMLLIYAVLWAISTASHCAPLRSRFRTVASHVKNALRGTKSGVGLEVGLFVARS